MNDVDGNDTDTIAVVETINGGLFLEITGNPTSTNTTPTTFPIVITTNGSTCTPGIVNNNITINPLSSLTIQAAMDDNQRICNNAAGSLTPVVYDIGNSLGVNVTWAPAQPAGITNPLTTINQISTITLDGVDGLVAANDGVPYAITINTVSYTYTLSTTLGGLDDEVSDILNGLATLITNAGIGITPTVNAALNQITLTSNGAVFTVATSNVGAVNALIFNAAGPTLVQAASRTVSIQGNPAVVGLAATTVYTYTIATVNSDFACNNPADQATVTGNITIDPEPTITLTSGSNTPQICLNEAIGTDIVYTIAGFATNASIETTVISQISTITLGGVDADVLNNNGIPYVITINAVNYTYTVDTSAPVT